MINLNGRHYAKRTIVMIGEILASNLRGTYMFCVKISLGDGELTEEWIYSKTKSLGVAQQIRNEIIEQVEQSRNEIIKQLEQ